MSSRSSITSRAKPSAFLKSVLRFAEPRRAENGGSGGESPPQPRSK